MSDQNDDLSPEELDALLRELEGRSGAGPAPKKEAKKKASGAKESARGADDGGADDGEDLEAFLRSLEEADDEPTPSRSATATEPKEDPFLAQFAELEEAEKTAMTREEPKKATKKTQKIKEPEVKADTKDKKDKKQRAKSGEEEGGEDTKAASAEQGQGLRRALIVGKWVGLVLPILLWWWMLGAYLGNWVSAGWLIALMATLFVFSLPALARHWLKKGRYVYWLAGISGVLFLGFVAPMPQQAGAALGSYGHWPASTVAELAGWPADHGVVRGQAALSQGLGEVLAPQSLEHGPQRLGTEGPLSPVPQSPPPSPVPPAPGEGL